MMDFQAKQAKQLYDVVRGKIKEAENKPFVVSVMGQTGVGKSSLLNALFNANLKTDPVRPCTKEVERVVTRGREGHELWFYDLPGIGESEGADARYLTQYREKILESDVVLWAIHCDNRSTSFDAQALRTLMNSSSDSEQAAIISRMTFVLTKADLLSSPPWIFGKRNDRFGTFAPMDETTERLEEKSHFYQEAFLDKYKHLIVSQTYNDGTFNVTDGSLSCDAHAVYHRGVLTGTMVASLQTRFPQHSATFQRLYDNYQVIPTSATFRFNLMQLMLVIINKLGADAVVRFKNFVQDDSLNRVSVEQAKRMCNLIVYDIEKNRVTFDLSEQKI